MSITRVLDCDGTITDDEHGTLLERFISDFYEKQPLNRKIILSLRGAIIRSYRYMIKATSKFVGEPEITGETNSFKLLDLLMLRKAQIPVSFLKEQAAIYSDIITPENVEMIKRCNDDIYIVSSEPVQLLEEIIRCVGISDNIKKVYGPYFKIESGIIKGFDKNKLVVGISGKHLGMADIVSNSRCKIYAIGDSAADMGLFTMYKHQVIPFTFYDADPDLVNYVKNNNGFVVKNLDEFFAKN